MKASKAIMRGIGSWLPGVLLTILLVGCDLPFPGPYQGKVTDADTGNPIIGAKVEAEWWCHDNLIPDGPGSFFVRSSTFTDEQGIFRIERQTHRGGIFGSTFALKIHTKGYIPANILAIPSGEPLPPSTKAYPFIQTTAYKMIPKNLDVKLKPAAPVFLKAMKNGEPLHRKIAREQLTKLIGVDYKYDIEKWEEALKSSQGKVVEQPQSNRSSKRPGCPCPKSHDKFKGLKEVRQKVRRLLNAATSGKLKQVENLLDSGIDVNTRNYACRTALMRAVEMGHLPLVKLLLSRGADVNLKDDNCRTALMYAASHYGSSGILQILLSRGAAINDRDKNGVTALMEAAKFGHDDAVQVLLSNGAEVNTKDKDGETAWFKAAVGDRKVVIKMLESHGANRK